MEELGMEEENMVRSQVVLCSLQMQASCQTLTSLHLNSLQACDVVDYTISMGKARSTKFPVTKGHMQLSVAFESAPRR